jgi:hypothetical protein
MESIPGKTVTWSPDPVADEHGSLSAIRFTTSAAGEVSATYQTVPEDADPADQIPPNEVTDVASFTVEVLDLVPELPRTIMVIPSATKTVTVHWFEPSSYRLTIHLEMVGTRPEFAGNVVADAEYILRPTGGTLPSGGRDYFGTGRLEFVTTPQNGNCLITYDGVGSIEVNSQVEIPDPFDPAMRLTTILALDEAARDTIVSTACGSSPAIVVSRGRISLFVLDLAGQFAAAPRASQPRWEVTGFTDRGGGVLEAEVTGGCGSPAICQLRATFRLEPVVP